MQRCPRDADIAALVPGTLSGAGPRIQFKDKALETVQAL
jgi:hypothetical protein